MAQASILQQLKTKQLDVVAAANRLVTSPDQIPDLIGAVGTEKGSAKYAYEKALRLVSEQRPELIYPHFDAFVAWLNHENNFLKWGAITTVANLTTVDMEGRFDALFDRYYAPVTGPTMITASNLVANSPRIVRAKPHLTQRIAREILKVENARYEHHGRPSPECRNIAIGHAIEAFDQFVDLVEDRASILAFVKRQRNNARKPVAKKAERFLRIHEAGVS